MDELIARITESAGLDAAVARKAVGIVLAFLQKEGPAAEVGQLVAALPGAEATIAEAQGGSGGNGLAGMIGGLMGNAGGIMGLAGQLTSAGVSMGQMQPLGKALFAYAREKAGEDVVGPIVGAVPGLSQFV
ncbi:DUF2267 domain-containing protein [Chelatococcus sp. SYSU_G07232]|uniref:DUF2267 domain-containing protein n=1 Tax=Chelatococcus albus TaxID=3047466 RepID=A0ABT7AJ62_9HYPH|nr:DUF2267 domain-containing protein [Chelatococcus sp. SYSU_G07232]MDJ1159417.1 DUF2267 domain-containing protein [Chelatococcus sp. SYSU_G07232]